MPLIQLHIKAVDVGLFSKEDLSNVSDQKINYCRDQETPLVALPSRAAGKNVFELEGNLYNLSPLVIN